MTMASDESGPRPASAGSYTDSTMYTETFACTRCGKTHPKYQRATIVVGGVCAVADYCCYCIAMFLVGLIVWTSICSAQEPSGEASPMRVVILGSSSACGPLGQRVARELQAHGTARPIRRCHSSTGLARPDVFDWQDEADRLIFSGARVIVMLGGNDTQGLRVRDGRGEWSWIRWRYEAAWRDTYAHRVDRFVVALARHRVQPVVVVLPPRAGDAVHEEHLVRVREAMRAGTEISGGAVSYAIDPSGVALPEHGAWLRDDVHLSHAGSAAVWEALGPQFLAAVGVQ